MDIKNCTLCPRKCGAIRTENEGKGFCAMGSLPTVARVAPHYWEEPCISGVKGSGTVFFSGCVMNCVYCQNYDISAKRQGKQVTPQRLAQYYKELEAVGVNNINLVTPTHFAAAIKESLQIYKPNIPVIYNCGGYENVETLKSLKGYIDIFLPDFKYATNELAEKYSGAPHYTDTALAAIKEMVCQQPQCVFNAHGIMTSGVIVRNLVLPLNTKNSIQVLHLLKENFGNSIYVSLMAQYTPCGNYKKYPELGRKITKREYDKVQNELFNLQLVGFTQELTAANKDFIPKFNIQTNL